MERHQDTEEVGSLSQILQRIEESSLLTMLIDSIDTSQQRCLTSYAIDYTCSSDVHRALETLSYLMSWLFL